MRNASKLFFKPSGTCGGCGGPCPGLICDVCREVIEAEEARDRDIGNRIAREIDDG